MVTIVVKTTDFSGSKWVAEIQSDGSEPTDPTYTAEGESAADAVYNLINKYPKETGVTIEEIIS